MVVVSRKSSPYKKWILIVSGIILLLLALGLLEKTNVINLIGSSNTDSTTKGPTKAQKAQEAKTNATNKQDFLDDTYKDKSDTPTSTQPEATSLSVSASQEGNNVVVLTKIQSVAQGTCKLTVTNASLSDTQEADVIYQPEFSSCAGFSVPVSKLGAGKWSIKLVVTPSTGTELTKTTTFEVK